MKQYFIGELIKKRRLELKLTQEQLGEGICEPITISRLENGRQTPSMNKLRVLLQRLDLPEDKYYALISKNEMQVSDLQAEIVSCNVLKDSERGLPKIAELEKLADPDDTLIQQFILRSKVILGKLEDGEIKPYSLEQRQDMLMQAIRLTSPKFNLEEIDRGLYSLDEVKVINQIAGIFSYSGQHKKAIDIYYQLLRYIKKHFQNILQSGGLLPIVAFNYARELVLDKHYDDALEMAQLGWQSCVEYGQYRPLPSAIALMAECYHFLGEDDKSMDYYKQAYYISKAVGYEKGVLLVLSETQKYFGDNFYI